MVTRENRDGAGHGSLGTDGTDGLFVLNMIKKSNQIETKLQNKLQQTSGNNNSGVDKQYHVLK